MKLEINQIWESCDRNEVPQFLSGKTNRYLITNITNDIVETKILHCEVAVNILQDDGSYLEQEGYEGLVIKRVLKTFTTNYRNWRYLGIKKKCSNCIDK